MKRLWLVGLGLSAALVATTGAAVALESTTTAWTDVYRVLARPLDAMLMGEEPAQSLGMPVEALKQGLIVLATLVTGTLVAVSGVIGFVGLIVPHAVRLLVGIPTGAWCPWSSSPGPSFSAGPTPPPALSSPNRSCRSAS